VKPDRSHVLARADVEVLVDAVLQSASERGLRVSVAVVDERGFDLVVVRGDGATWFTPDVARTKARTAAAFGRPTESLGSLKEGYPDLHDLVAEGLPFRPTALPGGLPIKRGTRVVGGLGVSGARPDEDVELAQVALAAAVDPMASS
jgi:uncharacterized protein GlcG (DUF336 family)